MIEIRRLSDTEAEALWSEIRPLLLPAFERSRGTYDAKTALLQLLNNMAQAWTVTQDGRIVAAAMTALHGLPQGKAGHVIALGGSGMTDWMSALHTAFEDFARAEGCTRLTLQGRSGWGRYLLGLGWSSVEVVMMKEI